jgi:hypothetical protein
MKKLILIVTIILMAGTTYGQTLKKGTIISLHVFTLTLSPGVTMDQYLDFCKTKYIPAFEKNFPGGSMYVIRGIKGECLNCNGTMTYWKTKTDMEKYYNKDGSATEITKATNAKLKPITDEFGKLGKITDRKYTSWEIQ